MPTADPRQVLAAAHSCEICGRAPAITIYASKYSGQILFGDEIFWKGNACRDCALCQYRSGLTHCLWAGWWGPVPFVVNLGHVWRNARGLVAANRMERAAGPPLAAPLEPGRPLVARPAAWAGVAAVTAMVVGIVLLISSAFGSSRLDELASGQCVDLGEGRTLDRADLVDCDAPHTAEVTGVLDSDEVPPLDRLCADETAEYLGTSGRVEGLAPSAIRFDDGDGRVVCLVVSADGADLTGTQRGAGG